MPWYAVDSLDDARRAAQSFLVPVDRGRWLRLAVIALFVGGAGGGGAPSGNVNLPGGTPPPNGVPGGGAVPGAPGGPPLPSFGEVLPIIVGVGLLVLALALVFGAIGGVMEFVLVEGLRSRDVRIRAFFGEYLGQGLRLFGFRLAVSLLALAVVGVPAVFLFLGGMGGAPTLFVLLLPLVLLGVLLALVVALVMRLTTDFVVPAMMVQDGGVVEGWRRFYPVVRGQLAQFALYVVVRFVLGIIAGIAVALVVGLLAVVLALPFLVVGGLAFFLLVGGGDPGLAFLALAGLLVAVYVALVVVLALLAQVPVVTYLRYYALFVLGEAEAELDLVADLRPDVPDSGGPGAV
jgi:hypothetical protein